MEIGDAVKHTLREGIVDGPTLWITQKFVANADAGFANMMGRGLPAEVRTPLVGLGLAVLPLMISSRPYASKVAEYIMANAVAQALTLAGNQGQGYMPGPLDTQVSNLFAPLSRLGSTAGMVQMGPRPGLTARPTAGYVGSRTGSYLDQRQVARVGQRPMGGGIRDRTLRGLTTEVQ